MSRIKIPSTIEAAPQSTHDQLRQVQAQLGTVPNLFRLIATSPAALSGYLGLSGALGQGRLPASTRERVALAIAELNGCSYCLSAHAYIGEHMAGLDAQEIEANRAGRSLNARADAAVRFAIRVAQARGRVTDEALAEIRSAGYDDAQLIEIVLHVALNVWTNYLNEVAQTDIDFPVVPVSPR